MLLALLLSGSAQAQQPTPSIQVKAVGVTNPTGTKTYAAPIKWFEEMEDPVYIYMFGSDPDMGVYAAEFQCTAQVTYLPTGWSTLSCRWTPGYPDIVPNGWQVGLPLAIAQDDLYFPEVQGFSQPGYGLHAASQFYATCIVTFVNQNGQQVEYMATTKVTGALQPVLAVGGPLSLATHLTDGQPSHVENNPFKMWYADVFEQAPKLTAYHEKSQHPQFIKAAPRSIRTSLLNANGPSTPRVSRSCCSLQQQEA